MKDGKMSNRHGLDELGHTRVTKIVYKKKQKCEPEQSFDKSYHSMDCSLKLENMKKESLVIVEKHATVNLLKKA